MNDLVHQGLSIGFPDGWEDRTELVIAGPTREGRNPAVNVKRIELQFDMTLAQFVGFQVHSLTVVMSVTKRDIIAEGDTTLAGLPAYKRIYRMKFADKPCVQHQYYMLQGRSAYVITMTSSPEQYADDAPVFDEIIRRFKLKA